MVLASVISTVLYLCTVGAEIAQTSQTKDNHLSVVSWCLGSVTKLGYYTGSVTSTVTGEECLKWTEFPDYVQQYPNKGLGDHNFCRNPDGETIPWCFYRKKTGSISWAECDCNHGAIRLSGGASQHEGRVELFYNGQWGTVCDKNWDDRDASVVCRQLSLSEIGVGKKNSFFGAGSGPIHMEGVHCRGVETALLHCGNSTLSNGVCRHDNDAGVVCGLPEGSVMPIRLVGGKEDYEGRVEVFHAGKWGTVCDDQWDDLDAEVVCRQLGLSGTAKSWIWSHFGQGSGPILLDEVECTGNELYLDECKKSNWGEHNCEHAEDAGVSCNPFAVPVEGGGFCRGCGIPPRSEGKQEKKLFQCGIYYFLAAGSSGCGLEVTRDLIRQQQRCKDGVIRLVGGRDSSEGRLELYRSGEWGAVCDDKWTELNAQVVCRQLGFSGPGTVAPEAKFGQGIGFIFLDDVVCAGTEPDLLGCARSNWGQHDCSHHEDVGVICAQEETNKITESNLGPIVRLVDGENNKEGRVEVYLNGEWGSVCDDGWTDRDARVVCRQLGYSGQAKARIMAYFGEGHGPIHLDNVKCTGHERSLDECGTPGFGIHNCWHSEDAGVICDYKEDPLEELSSGGSLPSVCGLRLMNRRKKRIIGGNKSIRGGWPWQVSLRLKTFYRESRLLCGATLISNCWVLTAAHCFKSGTHTFPDFGREWIVSATDRQSGEVTMENLCKESYNTRFGNDTRRYFIRVGDYHTAVEDEYEREIPVERIVTHKNYKPDSSDNDIALVRMKGREGHCVSFNQYAMPVCLPGRKEKIRINRQTCYITGWGDTGRSYSRTLLQGAVPLLPKNICKSRYRNKFTTRMICAGNLSEHKRVDSCQGDSGGPLMCQRTGGRWVILGITSWGYGCGRKDSPGVYTKVSKFVSWIKKVTKTKVKTEENMVSKLAQKP